MGGKKLRNADLPQEYFLWFILEVVVFIFKFKPKSHMS